MTQERRGILLIKHLQHSLESDPDRDLGLEYQIQSKREVGKIAFDFCVIFKALKVSAGKIANLGTIFVENNFFSENP